MFSTVVLHAVRWCGLQRAAAGRRLLGCLVALALVSAWVGVRAAEAGAATAVGAVVDTYSRSDRPNTNYGGSGQLIAAAGGAPGQAYLRFDVVVPAGSAVSKATLRVYALSPSGSSGVALRSLSDTAWGERSLTWHTAPEFGSSTMAQATGYAKGSWVSLDATSLVKGGGPVSMVLTTSGSTSRSFSSRESARNRPQLVIETAAATPTPTPTPTPEPTPTPDRLLGLFAGGDGDFATIRSIGFNAITTNTSLTDLDRAHANGLKALVWLGGFENEPTCAWRQSDAWVTEQVNKVKNHPAVIGYQIDNEPHAAECPDAPRFVRERAQLVRSLDPNLDHVTMMALYRSNEFDDYANATDVVRVGIYPCNVNTGCDPQRITTKVGVARMAGWTRLWGSPQAFGDAYYRIPTPAELQTILDTWRANGIENLFAYTWDVSDPVVLRDHPELWPVFTQESQR